MTNELLSKKIISMHNRSVELKKKMDEFHKENKVERRQMSDSQFNYILSFITMAEYMQERIDSLLYSILTFNRKSESPITKKQVYILIAARKRLKRLEFNQRNLLE